VNIVRKLTSHFKNKGFEIITRSTPDADADLSYAASSGPSFLQQLQQQQPTLPTGSDRQASSFTVNVHVANAPSMPLVQQQITDLETERAASERRVLHEALSELRELPSMLATEVEAQIGVQTRALLAKMIAVQAPLGLPQGPLELEGHPSASMGSLSSLPMLGDRNGLPGKSGSSAPSVGSDAGSLSLSLLQTAFMLRLWSTRRCSIICCLLCCR